MDMASAFIGPVNDSGGTLLLWLFLFIIGPRLRRAAVAKRRCLGRRTTRRLERCAPGLLARAQKQQQWCVVTEGILTHAMWRFQTAQTASTYFPGSLKQGEVALLFVCSVAASVMCHAHDIIPSTTHGVTTSRQPGASKRRCRSRPSNFRRGEAESPTAPSVAKAAAEDPSHLGEGPRSARVRMCACRIARAYCTPAAVAAWAWLGSFL